MAAHVLVALGRSHCFGFDDLTSSCNGLTTIPAAAIKRRLQVRGGSGVEISFPPTARLPWASFKAALVF